ncbi:MAG: RidA family protein [Candidatus Bruticola sp.]
MELKQEIVISNQAPQAIGPYSQAVCWGNLVFCSGQIPLDPQNGTIVGATTAEQTKQALKNLQNVLEAAGSDLSKVLKTTCFLDNIADFAEFNEVYAQFFTDNAPARSAIQAAALPKGVKIEVEAIAYRNED